jgi:hypothetical protein
VDYEPELVLSALLGDPLRRLVRLIVQERVKDYDGRRITLQPPLFFSKTDQFGVAPLTTTSSHQSKSKPNPVTSPTYSAGDQSPVSSTAIPSSSQWVPVSNGDDDDEPSKPQNPETLHVAAAMKKTPIPRPNWVNEVDQLAKEHNTKIVFVDVPQIPLRMKPQIESNIGGFYRTTKLNGTVTIYHGCRVRDDLQDIEAKLRSFVRTGVDIDRGDVKGFLSNSRAVYYSNSIDYAFLWPVIQTRFAVYRRYTRTTIPQIPVLIICQNINIEDTLPGSLKFSCWRIPQENTRDAQIVSPTSFHNLTCQFVNENMNSSLSGIKRHSPRGTTRNDFQIVTSPLPYFKISELESCPLRTEILNSGLKAKNFVVVAGCDRTAATYLASSTPRVIIVCYLGDGELGVGVDEGSWGTVGMSKSYLDSWQRLTSEMGSLRI